MRFLNPTGGLSAGYVAHPSFVDDDELSAITAPLSISAAEIDTIFTTDKRHASEVILIKTNVPWEIDLYGAVSHGFAVRGDLKDEKLRYAMEAAFEQAVRWFRYHVK